MTLRAAHGFMMAEDNTELSLLFPAGYQGTIKARVALARAGAGAGPMGVYLVANEEASPFLWQYKFPSFQSHVFIGFALYMTSQIEGAATIDQLGTQVQATLQNQTRVRFGPVGIKQRVISLWGPDGMLGESSSLNAFTWYYVEIRIKAPTTTNGTDGQWEIRLNNATVASGTGKTGQSTLFDIVWFNPRTAFAGADFYLGDIYIIDASGGPPLNTFIGDHIATYILPSSDVLANWSRFSGNNNYEAVDDFLFFDRNTTRIFNSAPTIKDLYGTLATADDGGGAGPIIVNINFVCRHRLKVPGSPRFIDLELENSDGANTQIAAFTTNSTNWLAQFHDLPVNPITGLPWTVQDITTKGFKMGLTSRGS